jgi:hypothetical protein
VSKNYPGHNFFLFDGGKGILYGNGEWSVVTMGHKNFSFRLSKPGCPCCESEEVYFVRSFGNYLKIAFNVILCFLLYPVFSYKLRCRQCGQEFRVDKINER